MSYKYELHCHTAEGSRCATAKAEQVVEFYKEHGYDGVVITDHYSPQTFTGVKAVSPQKYIDYYSKGYRNALERAGDDFTVLFGVELRFFLNVNDYLIYGVTEELLKRSGNLMAYYPKRAYKWAKENGLLLIQAHPFRGYIYRGDTRFLDGCEVYNAKDNRENNDKAQRWFDSADLEIKTSGSDLHHIPKAQRALGGIITEEPIRTNDDLLRIILSGEYELIRQ